MNKEIIQALRTENEALRMLIDSIGKRLALQQEQLDLLLQACEPAPQQPAAPQAEIGKETQPQPIAIEQEPNPEPPVEEPVSSTPSSESLTTHLEETPAEPITIKPQSSGSLNDLLERQNLSDFRKAFSLNDRFRFRRELFGGSEALMNQVIADLNEIKSYEESITYINKVLQGSVEESAMADFLQLIEKRFT